MGKRYLGTDVLTAARQRTARVFDDFPVISVSFSGGKDSGVVLDLACAEARRRGRRVTVLFIDLEAQYTMTVDYVAAMLERNADVADPCWVCLPLNLRNAVSQFEPQWMCWEPGREADWVRQPPRGAITGESFFPFFRRRMEFEEFCPEWALWHSGGRLACQLVGIRTQESLNRWRTVASRAKNTHDGLAWTTWTGGPCYNAYPVYDWRTEDIWGYYARENVPYNALYDRMHQAGLSIHQARICQPYGDDQRKGLWLYQLIEPDSWARVVARVNGANMGALYARESGNVLGRIRVAKPEGITWRQFAEILLASMPAPAAEQYRCKIAMFHKYYWERGYDQVPDEGPASTKGVPSWTRICKTILRNDYHCKGLTFSPTKTGSYQKYLALMRRRRQEWGLD